MKHHPRACTICRDYGRHRGAQRSIGRWWLKLGRGRVHLVRKPRGGVTACGRRRTPGMLWSLERRLVDCATCRRGSP